MENSSPPPPNPPPLPPFLSKTFDMVDDSLTDPIVSWSPTRPDGFVVWEFYEFSGSLLPQFFKHNNFSSFVRQLNTYGFRKADPERWEFAHEEFRKGQRHRLRNIQRKRPTSSRSLRAVSLAVQSLAQEGALLSQARKRVDDRSTSCGVNSEVVQLTSERDALLLELSGLESRYQAAHRCMNHISDQLEMLEVRQRHIVGFVARTLCAPKVFYKSVDRAIASDRILALQEHTECNGYALNSLVGEAKRRRLSVCTAQRENGRELVVSHGQTALEMNPSNGKGYANAHKLKQETAAWTATESEEVRETAAGLDNKLITKMGLQKVNADPCIALHSLEANCSSSGVLGRENVACSHDAGVLSSACNALLRPNNCVNLPLLKGPKLEEDEDLQTADFDVQGFTWRDSPFSFEGTQDAFEDLFIENPLPFAGSKDAIEELLLFNNVQQATHGERR